MPSPDILDFEALLQPISDEAPAGEDLRSDPSPTSVYYQIKDARAAARAEERAQVEGDDDAVPDGWRTILKVAPEALATRSKDLELVSTLIEALARTHGFEGIRDGYRLARELVERFWDGLYPQPDEDGLETRVAPLAGLNGVDAEGTLIAPIQLIPVTQDAGFGRFNSWTYQRAHGNPGSEEHGHFQASLAGTDPQYFVTLIEDIDQALEHHGALSAKLDELCGAAVSPPSSAIRSALSGVKEQVEEFARDILALARATEGGDEEAGAEAAEPGQPAAAAGGPPGAIQTRNDALRRLNEVAEYYRRTEPHSPVSFLVDKAVRWGQTPLAGLLTELIPDAEAREHFSMLTGIENPVDKEEEEDN